VYSHCVYPAHDAAEPPNAFEPDELSISLTADALSIKSPGSHAGEYLSLPALTTSFISIQNEAGEVLALVGPSGRQIYDIQSHPALATRLTARLAWMEWITNTALASLRTQSEYPQETQLFSDIRKLQWEAGCSDGEPQKASQCRGFHRAIASGLRHLVGERGVAQEATPAIHRPSTEDPHLF
jgi:hypothetical protein